MADDNMSRRLKIGANNCGKRIYIIQYYTYMYIQYINAHTYIHTHKNTCRYKYIKEQCSSHTSGRVFMPTCSHMNSSTFLPPTRKGLKSILRETAETLQYTDRHVCAS